MACDVPQPLDEGKQPIGFVSRHELSREFGEIVDRSLRQVMLELLPQGLLRMETPVSPQSPVPVRPPVKPSRWPQGAAASSSSLGALGCSSSMASACSARRPLFATQSSDLSVADSEGATSFKDAAICRSRLGARPQALRVSAAKTEEAPRGVPAKTEEVSPELDAQLERLASSSDSTNISTLSFGMVSARNLLTAKFGSPNMSPRSYREGPRDPGDQPELSEERRTLLPSTRRPSAQDSATTRQGGQFSSSTSRCGSTSPGRASGALLLRALRMRVADATGDRWPSGLVETPGRGLFFDTVMVLMQVSEHCVNGVYKLLPDKADFSRAGSIFRILRIFRTLRVFRLFEELAEVMEAVMRSVRTFAISSIVSRQGAFEPFWL